MKKTAFTILAVVCFWAPLLKAEAPEADPLDATSKSLMDESFVVETSDDDVADSLNRISGNIDSGFAPKESTYRAVHHGRSGPFTTHEDAYDVSR